MDELVRLKRKLRQLKRLETRVRFGGQYDRQTLIWDEFFSTRGDAPGRYGWEELLAMTAEERKEIYAQFVYAVYFRQYKANGIFPAGMFDPMQLAELGLPPDADRNQVRRRFRELAKKMHPDQGGSAEAMIKLLEQYNRLMENKT